MIVDADTFGVATRAAVDATRGVVPTASILLVGKAPADHKALAIELGVQDLLDVRDDERVAMAVRREHHTLLLRQEVARLRRKLDEYEKNVPPHVQAARLCESRGLKAPRRGSWVEYVVTTAGAEPAGKPLAPLDYQHYIDRQLQPVADGILGFAGTSFSALVDQQFALF